MIDFFELNVAFLISAIFKNSQRRSFNIKNRRYIHYNMSLVIWMLKIAEIILNSSHSKTDLKKHHQFVILYNKLSMNVSLEKKNRKTYNQTKKKLMKHTINLINVIVTTLSNSEETALYFAFRSQLIIIDEITRAVKLNVWNILRNYCKTSLIMIENEAQLHLVILSTKKNNKFVSSLRMSLFYRFKFLRQFSMLLNV
jgi:hypothetical protein